MSSSLAAVRKRLMSGGAIVFVSKILMLVAGVGVNAFLARLLSPQEFGDYFLMFSIVVFASQFAQFGTLKTVVRIVSGALATNRPDRARSAVGKTIAITLFASLVISMTLMLGGGEILGKTIFNSEAISRNILLLTAWVILFALQELFAGCFLGFNMMVDAAVINRLFTTLLFFTFLIVVSILHLPMNLNMVLTLMVACLGISVFYASVRLSARVSKLPASTETSLSFKEVIAVSLPLLVVGLAPSILDNVGLWVIGAVRGQEEVAIYSSAVRLMKLVTLPLMVINVVLAPMISEFYQSGRIKEFEQQFRSIATVVGLLGFSILGFMMLFGAKLLGLIFGDYYTSGYSTLCILLLGKAFNAWTGSCGLLLMMTNGERVVMYIVILSATILIPLSYYLVHDYGINGVALATALTTLFQYALLLLFAKRRVGIWTHMYMSPRMALKALAQIR